MNWFTLETQAYNRQQKCSHRKGAIGSPLGPRIDYNVAMHTFPNGETKIWCLSNCGWNVWNRPGWSFKWAIGMRMVEYSTNWPSSSQVSAEMLKGKHVLPVRTDLAGVHRVVYYDKDKV